MRWDQSGYGAHTEKAAGGTALTWYFAEGSQGFFSTYLLLANPGTTASTATVQYLREGLPALTRSYPIAAGSRFTVNAGADPELVNTSFGMTVTFDQPGIAERAMYFGSDPVWKGGHESAGVTAPSTDVVPRGRRDGPVLRNVRPARESEWRRRGGDDDVPDERRRADREREDGAGQRTADGQHRVGRSGAGERRGLDEDRRVAAGDRRARAVLARSRAGRGTKRTTASA